MPDSVLAVDLGKTGCRAALWVGEAYMTAEGPGAPGLAAPDGAAVAEAAVRAVVAPLLHAAGLGAVEMVGVGAAGALASPAAARELAERLCAGLPAAETAVTSDAVTSHAGALGGGPGLVLAVGTGSVAVAVGSDGVLHRADGWGPWLGDEGGGAWLGLRGLRAALRAADGRGPATLLQAVAEARVGALTELAALLEGSENPAHLTASFAADVAHAAEHGDAAAAELLRRATEALVASALAAARRLPGAGPFPFALIGGLTELAPALTQRITQALQAGSSLLNAVPPAGTALDGARLLAVRRDTVHERGITRITASRTAPAHGLDTLPTEGVRPGLEDLDLRPPDAVVHLVLQSERVAQAALARAAPQLAAAATAVAARMLAGGRLFYLGAGTSGRLAVLDAAELGPTYSVPPGMVIALLAGGANAMVQAAEGAEDDPDAAACALDAHALNAADAVVGIAASGRTPYVVGGLRHARSRGALSVAVVNNPGSPAAAEAALAVEILTGPELIAGSTRMTAATAQKVALNAISTACMVALGKTYGAHMVDVRATNAKLRRRALRMVREITGADEAEAAAALAAVGCRVKPAVVALLAGVDAAEAERRLAQAGGRVRDAVSGGIVPPRPEQPTDPAT